MRIAWFTHRYHPCVGGAENYGRAMVRRFVAAGHDVRMSDQRRARPLVLHRPAPAPGRCARRVDRVDGARVRRFPVRHLPLQRYVGQAPELRPALADAVPGRLVHADHPRHRAGPGRLTTRSSRSGSRTRSSPTPRCRRPGRPGAPLILTPFLHLATPGDPVNRHYTRPHQIRLLAEADTVVVQTDAGGRRGRAAGASPRRGSSSCGMAVEHAEVTGGDRPSAPRPPGHPRRAAAWSASSAPSTRTRGRTTWSAPSPGSNATGPPTTRST